MDDWDHLAKQSISRHDVNEFDGRVVPIYARVASFIRHYGMDAFMNDLYPTDDKVIPFKRFFLLEKGMRATMAQERIALTDATALAIGVAMNGNAPSVKEAIRNNIEQAYGK